MERGGLPAVVWILWVRSQSCRHARDAFPRCTNAERTSGVFKVFLNNGTFFDIVTTICCCCCLLSGRTSIYPFITCIRNWCWVFVYFFSSGLGGFATHFIIIVFYCLLVSFRVSDINNVCFNNDCLAAVSLLLRSNITCIYKINSIFFLPSLFRCPVQFHFKSVPCFSIP
jgi:hypothetical protein